MSLSAKDKLRIKAAAHREAANVLADAVDCDGFKHRELPDVSDKDYSKADELFFEEVDLVVEELRKRGAKCP